MKTDELIKIGFLHRYKPNLKRIDEQSLGYVLLYEHEVITIELFYFSNTGEWSLNYISFSGNITYKLLQEEIKECSLEAICNFVKKYPPQTF